MVIDPQTRPVSQASARFARRQPVRAQAVRGVELATLPESTRALLLRLPQRTGGAK